MQSDFRSVSKTLLENVYKMIIHSSFLRNCFGYFVTHVVIRVIRAYGINPQETKWRPGEPARSVEAVCSCDGVSA